MPAKYLLCLVLGIVPFLAGDALAASRTARENPNARASRALGRTVPAINFTNVTLRDAVDFLRDISGVNIQVNWKALEQTGITPDTTVTIKLRQVTLRKVMDLLLSEAAGGPLLAYYVDDGVIEVTTREVADSRLVTRIYPVQDVLIEPPEFVVPDFSLGSGGGAYGSNGYAGQGVYGQGGYSGGSYGGRSTGGYGSGGYGAGGYRGGYGGAGGMFGVTPDFSQKDKDAKAKELVDMIKETIEPRVWIDNGGKASIKIFNGNLIVTAPRSVHERIGGPIE